MNTAQIRTSVQHFVTQAQYCMLVLFLLVVGPLLGMAQEDHSHAMTSQQNLTSDQQHKASELIRIVRESTERFKNVAEAEHEGYALQFGCVTGPDSGAMGLHFVNMALVNSGIVDATHPQIVIYEPTGNGNLKLIGADFLVVASGWDAKHSGPPELMGQLFHYWESPNRFGLPAFYTLHVWAWKDNPNGAFVNWHPNVNCEQFSGRLPEATR